MVKSERYFKEIKIIEMAHEVKTSWNGGMTFESEVNGHKIFMDAEEKFGGKDLGPRPKPLLLTALSGCTGMDVISLLNKMRANYSKFDLHVTGEVSDSQPKVYTKIHLTYEIKIDEADKDKMERAVKLSQETMCGVSSMLKKAAELTWKIKYLS